VVGATCLVGSNANKAFSSVVLFNDPAGPSTEWAQEKTIPEIAKAIRRIGKGDDPYHSLRVALTQMHTAYKNAQGDIVKLPHRVSQKTLKLATKAGKKASAWGTNWERYSLPTLRCDSASPANIYFLGKKPKSIREFHVSRSPTSGARPFRMASWRERYEDRAIRQSLDLERTTSRPALEHRHPVSHHGE
jgi:hypothetical protein